MLLLLLFGSDLLISRHSVGIVNVIGPPNQMDYRARHRRLRRQASEHRDEAASDDPSGSSSFSEATFFFAGRLQNEKKKQVREKGTP